ncbi:DUF262 domain-containing protein [Microvenator marinus]|uniref:DUF262 domain-containing protein n=1 Tax=Microvenator marinus TaxID=2600177 RepID=A0A5B8XWC1_9DELT|nr:DUF262 domain-containing protein [Microvenator marinus]QED29471.1 DUF262 domain-containing protein [Microvenator marinus]
MAELRLRSVGDLLNERFFVPDYQRGYRWTKREVEALLNDVEAFYKESKKNTSGSSFYCLQPIVVSPREDGSWELIDGQQRLTTILLILRELGGLAPGLLSSVFSVEYETRMDSHGYLMDPQESLKDANIDFAHIYDTWAVIREWVSSRGTMNLHLLTTFIQPDDEGPNVRVIWYELDQSQKPAEAFIRLNMGRIPLTNSELIRALFLSESNDLHSSERNQIAQDWDLLEKQLHRDEFWYFLQNSSSRSTRIEFLFDLFVRVNSTEEFAKGDQLQTFLEFQKLFESGDVRILWKDFKHMAATLEEWFEDRTLFHLVGFLTTSAEDERKGKDWLVKLLNRRQSLNRRAFERYVLKEIWKVFQVQTHVPEEGLFSRLMEHLEELSYDESRDRRAIRATLLLFNIAEMLQNDGSNHRFHFGALVNDRWDIEHVRSVAEYIPGSPADRRAWLERACDFLATVEQAAPLKQEVEMAIEKGLADDALFEHLFMGIREVARESGDFGDGNSISNLVLLDSSTNRGYKNSIFPVKRLSIIGLDFEGQFVPPATRNVFLKYYTKTPSQLMYWDEQDQEEYWKTMLSTFERFFEPLTFQERV